MSATLEAPPVHPDDEATHAGNYFVSNYPPFSTWQTERTQEAFDALQRKPNPGTALGVYVHIPFCRKRCHFCYFRVYTDKDSTQIKAYIEAVAKEHDAYAAKPFIDGRKPKFVYFGGGTPSYLSSDQLHWLVERMKATLPWTDVEEVTFECEPGTLTEHKLKVIRDHGVTRLSLGVEHFDDHVLEINGRAHHSKEIGRAYEWARQLKFPQINIDLIAGMVEDTTEKWHDTVAKALVMQPDSVTVYQMEVPYNTTIYKEMKSAGKLIAPVADWPTKRGWVEYAFGEFEKAGYTVASAYTVVKDKSKTKFLYRDMLWSGADLMGLGVASFSHVGGTHFQNLDGFLPYIEACEANKLPINRAYTPTEQERFIREFILQLKLGRVSIEYFRNKFGRDVEAEFAVPFATLKGWGYLSVANGQVLLNRAGLLRVDRLLHEFFLPEHQNVRYT